MTLTIRELKKTDANLKALCSLGAEIDFDEFGDLQAGLEVDAILSSGKDLVILSKGITIKIPANEFNYMTII